MVATRHPFRKDRSTIRTDGRPWTCPHFFLHLVFVVNSDTTCSNCLSSHHLTNGQSAIESLHSQPIVLKLAIKKVLSHADLPDERISQKTSVDLLHSSIYSADVAHEYTRLVRSLVSRHYCSEADADTVVAGCSTAADGSARARASASACLRTKCSSFHFAISVSVATSPRRARSIRASRRIVFSRSRCSSSCACSAFSACIHRPKTDTERVQSIAQRSGRCDGSRPTYGHQESLEGQCLLPAWCPRKNRVDRA